MLVRRRINVPARQSTPSPNGTPLAVIASPCRNSADAVEGKPLAWSTIVSGFVAPLARSDAPLASTEFAQPRPGAPVLPHGHGVESVPSPAQNGAELTSQRVSSISK